METRKHPLDFSKLHKGMWIETAELEAAVMSRRFDRGFSLSVAKLAGRIYEETGIPCFQKDDRLRLMSDDEIAPYMIKRQKEAVRVLGRVAEYASAIDVSALTDSQRRYAEAASVAAAAVALAARKERSLRMKQLRALPSGG